VVWVEFQFKIYVVRSISSSGKLQKSKGRNLTNIIPFGHMGVVINTPNIMSSILVSDIISVVKLVLLHRGKNRFVFINYL